ncbi:uncharacterized protein [Choristoneura fumiferana]|uniref:uncharacterized protein n=1 Tax=Choristoneura fumiferana TaxID=7141 RepID=UPI003D156E95
MKPAQPAAMRIPSPSRFPPPANLPPPFAATNKRRLSPSPSSTPRPTIPRLELSPMDLPRGVTCEDIGTDDDELGDRSGTRDMLLPPAPHAPSTPPPPPPPPPPSPAPPAAAQGKRYPPFMVDVLPEWPKHFRKLREKLGYPPHAAPANKGIIFTPHGEEEYRTVDRYLRTIPDIQWHCYRPNEELNVKIAVIGLPANTEPEEIVESLREKGFLPIFASQVRARAGRPGCIFHVQLQRTTETVPAIYRVNELLGMLGVRVEAWKGKKGPAQCHRCQAFRHSSANCHRRLACVRCGDEHFARDCPRPREDPPTCVNCRGPHTANSTTCPVFKTEARHRTAGIAPRSRATIRAGVTPAGATSTSVEKGHAPNSLMAAANDGRRPPTKRRRKRGGRKRKASRPRAARARADTQRHRKHCR